MLYRNIKTGNILSPANAAGEVLMANSPLYEPVRPVKPIETAQEPPDEDTPKELPEDASKEPTKAPKNKKE